MKNTLIIQARMASKRLPGKVLRTVLGKPLLHYVWRRAKQTPGVDTVVIATTTNREDNEIERFCRDNGIDCYRGSETDVLSRYYEAAVRADATAVVRITADCPLIDPAVVGKVLGEYLAVPGRYDYVSNALQRSYPVGLDAEAFSVGALQKAFESAKAPHEREHVTPYIYSNPEIFNTRNVSHDPDLSFHRWTVDTYADFELVGKIIESFGPRSETCGLEEILALLSEHPEWSRINSNVIQRSYKHHETN